MNQWGALAGIVVGGITGIVWSRISGGLFDLYEIAPGFVFSLVAIVLVSLVLTKIAEYGAQIFLLRSRI